MQTLMTIVGVVLLVCVVIAITAGFVIYAMESINKLYMSVFNAGREAGVKKALADLDADAFWFSEDLPTMLMLREYATGRQDISEVREKWRGFRRSAMAIAQEWEYAAAGQTKES